MADWDKAAEQIAQIHALQEECLAMLRQMRAELQASNARPLLSEMTQLSHDSHQRTMSLARSRLLTDTISDVLDLKRRLAEIEARLTALEQRR